MEDKMLTDWFKEATPTKVKFQSTGDSKKGIEGGVIVFKFNDNIDGKNAWQLWSHMTLEQKKKTGFHKSIVGKTVFLLPGMSMCIYTPDGGVYTFGEPNNIHHFHKLSDKNAKDLEKHLLNDTEILPGLKRETGGLTDEKKEDQYISD